MSDQYTWEESKRQANLDKHKLDFMDADWVLDSPYHLDIETERKGERRQQSFAYVFGQHIPEFCHPDSLWNIVGAPSTSARIERL